MKSIEFKVGRRRAGEFMKLIMIIILLLPFTSYSSQSCHQTSILRVPTVQEQLDAYFHEVGEEQATNDLEISQSEDSALIFNDVAEYDYSGMAANENNVIVITMDGIRSYEFFNGTSWLLDKKLPRKERGRVFNYLWSEFIPNGVLYGRRGINSTFKSADEFGISLPNYQNLFLGHHHGFGHRNSNPRVEQETFMERIRRELDLPHYKVAAIGSWSGVNKAVAKDPLGYFINIGRIPLVDGTGDDYLNILNREQDISPQWDEKNQDDRADIYTWKQSIHYLKKHKPRLLYINLLDADEFGHNNDYVSYIRSLRWFDSAIKQLMDLLNSELREYGKKTTIFITTDHSRGYAWMWKDHGLAKYTERNIFLAARGPYAKKMGRVIGGGVKNHRHIRPTVEALMGLESQTGYSPLMEMIK